MCSHKGASLTQPQAHPLPLCAQCCAMEMDNAQTAQRCQAAWQQKFGLPTWGLGALAAGAGAMGRQLSRHLGVRRQNRDFLREQQASVAEAECSTLAAVRLRGWSALLAEAAAAAMPPWPCSATAAHSISLQV